MERASCDHLKFLWLELKIEAEGLDPLREDHVLAGVLILGVERVYLGVRGRLAVVVGAVGPDDGQLAAAVAARPRDGGNLEGGESSFPLSFPQQTAIQTLDIMSWVTT